MKLWVFDVYRDTTLENSNRYFVEEIEFPYIKVWITPQKYKVTEWQYIDELKAHGFIQYRTSFRTTKDSRLDAFFEASFEVDHD